MQPLPAGNSSKQSIGCICGFTVEKENSNGGGETKQEEENA